MCEIQFDHSEKVIFRQKPVKDLMTALEESLLNSGANTPAKMKLLRSHMVNVHNSNESWVNLLEDEIVIDHHEYMHKLNNAEIEESNG